MPILESVPARSAALSATSANRLPQSRLRVLILADSCNPDWVSLPAVAFKACRAIAELADVVLVTNARNKSAISREGCGLASVTYIDNELIASPLYRLAKILRGGDSVAWTTNVAMQYPSYLAFEWLAWRRFRSELRAGAFDIVHRLTPMSPTTPSPMASWSPVPFVLGPLNGGLRWPDGYRGELKREREYLSFLRAAFRWLPYHRSTFAKARVVLAAFRHTIEDLHTGAGSAVFDFPEVGIDTELFHPAQRDRPLGRLTFLFAGRLVPYKCADVLIAAFACSPALRRHRLVIVGDGPERAMLLDMVAAHELEECVEFAGWKNQAQVAELMRSADVFAFPSIRELGAGVVIEAMACGAVPVVVNYGGPGALVDDTCGVRVALGPKGHLVSGFTRALEALATDRLRLQVLREACVERALCSFSWEAKARKMIEVYEWALGKRGAPSDFAEAPEPAPREPTRVAARRAGSINVASSQLRRLDPGT